MTIDFFMGWVIGLLLWVIGLLLCHFLPRWLSGLTIWWKFRHERRTRAKEDILAKTFFTVKVKPAPCTCPFPHPPELQ